ncbi:hypothetical protein MCP1_190045 [Candidatus Terasakiella magnetica]|nr:hypothetical protein MCP1_190045 [Candidatus Terasakiella magnetica]
MDRCSVRPETGGYTLGNGTACSLSDRERQSLMGVAAGYSLWEVATALELPENAVGRMLREARHKLGVGSTAEAIITARMLGLLGV